MGCFFSKKSRRKSPEKELVVSGGEEAAGNNVSENTAVSGTEQTGQKQYSWDKREKVRSLTDQDKLSSVH